MNDPEILAAAIAATKSLVACIEEPALALDLIERETKAFFWPHAGFLGRL